MAFKCNVNPWLSRINVVPSASPNDGFITIDPPDATTGNFTGTHHGPIDAPLKDFPITGNCKHPTAENPNQPDFILFTRLTADGCAYVHFGEIVVLSGKDWVIKGIRRKICGALPADPTASGALAGDDEWVGEKVT